MVYWIRVSLVSRNTKTYVNNTTKTMAKVGMYKSFNSAMRNAKKFAKAKCEKLMADYSGNLDPVNCIGYSIHKEFGNAFVFDSSHGDISHMWVFHIEKLNVTPTYTP